MNRRCVLTICAVLAWSITSAGRAGAQTVRGWVLDESNGQPVRGASVSVLHVIRDTVLAARVTDDRPFEIFMREAGNYRLRVEAFGYTTMTTDPVRLPEEVVLTLELKLRANAIALAPLRVLAERTEAPFMRDVRARQASGFGRVVTREDMEQIGGGKLQDVLTTVPGVRIRNYDYQGRSVPLVETRAAIGLTTCFAAFYLNGVRQFEMRLDQTGTGIDPVVLERADDLAALSISDIEAVEVYRGAAEVPPEYSGSTSQCGVVAIWTRTGYDPPLPARDRPHLLVTGAAMQTYVSGNDAPGSAFGPEFGLFWRRSSNVWVGLRLQTGRHTLPPDATDQLTQRLDARAYRLPPGERPLSLYIGGLETRVAVLDRSSVRGMLSGRLNGARRSFTVDHAASGRAQYESKAWGFGAGAGLELQLVDRLAADIALAHDWLFFGSYPNLDRPNEPTSATWRALSFRIGLGWIATHGSGG